MKKLLIGLALAAAGGHLAFAETSLDAQLAEAARLTGAQAAGSVAGMSPKIDANGQPVLDAKGKPVMEASSAESMRGGLRMFQDITGIQGATSTSAPSQGPQGSGVAKVAFKKSFQFSCQANGSKGPFSAGPLAFLVDTCSLQAGSATVLSVNFFVCDNAEKAGTCDTAADYPRKVTVASGQYSALGTVSMGLGCNSTGTCLLSLSGDSSFGGNDAVLKAKSAEMAAGSNVLKNLRDNVIGSDYGAKVKEIGTPFAECARANQTAAQHGNVVTCEETPQTVQLTATQSNATCGGARECAPDGWATTVTSFPKTCNRTFPTTQRITQLAYTKTATCERTEYLADSSPASNSCKPDDATDETAGLTLVGATARACTGGVNAKGECLSTSWKEYWAQTTNPSLIAQTAVPARVGGSCDTSVSSQTRTVSCSNWFGRTGTLQECTAPTGTGDSAADAAYLGLSYLQVAGCGVCLEPTIGETCYATTTPTAAELQAGAEVPDSCQSLDLNNCTLTSATVLNYSGDGSGLVTGQAETYACKTETRQCTKWKAQDSSCLSTDMAQGLDKLHPDSGRMDASFNNAMVAAATMDGVAKGLDGPQDGTIPRLFTGEALACHRPAGGLGQALQKNCCRADLQRPVQGNVIQGGCKMPEVKLAAARRSGYATYIGDYCSRQVKTLFFRYCLEMASSYCVFPGILPRLVQEQGRDQLTKMTALSTNADIQRAPLNFSYYDRNPNAASSGSWSPVTVVNGVRIAAWQWPAYCATPEVAGEMALNNPSAKSCPGVVSSWVATCDAATGCGELPPDPLFGAFNWILRDVNPLQVTTSAVSKYAVVKGACNTESGQCNYEVSAWPASIGGKAVVSKEIAWELYGEMQPLTAEGKPAPLLYQLNNMGDLMFKGYTGVGIPGSVLPATVRMDFSRDGGQTWVQLSVPTTGLEAAEMTLPNSDVTVTGGCDQAKNLCTYRATGTFSVSAKSWGSAKNPDCTGFTVGQMAVLDFSKMDLSEWLASVMDKMASKDPSQLASQAAAQFSSFNALYQSGNIRSAAPTSANFARVLPAEGFGPFVATLSVSGYWPEGTGDPAKDVDKVTRVEVDWGDCEPPEMLSPVDPSLGVGFRGSKRYEAPDTYACSWKPSAPGNTVHTVTLRAWTTNSGIQARKVSVENAWAKFPGADANRDHVGAAPEIKALPARNLPPPLVK